MSEERQKRLRPDPRRAAGLKPCEIWLETDLVRRLDEARKGTRMNRSEIIGYAVSRFLKNKAAERASE